MRTQLWLWRISRRAKGQGALDRGWLKRSCSFGKCLAFGQSQDRPFLVGGWIGRCKNGIKQKIPTATHGIYFSYQRGFLLITLPSGRKLAYVKPRIGQNRLSGVGDLMKGSTKKWQRIESYGPKFVENIVQAISRDILAEAMTRPGPV